MNITQAARAVLLGQLTHIANNGNTEALQAMLSGAGLPALARDDEAAEQIHDALESGDHYASLARRIAHLLASLIRRRADALAQRLAVLESTAMGGGSTLVYERVYLQDETYVFNLFLLASRLPRREELFGGLQRFHEVGFKLDVILSSAYNRVGFQLRRALAEQQHDSRLRDYWLNLLQDRSRPWIPARRTELLEAWHGLLATLDFDTDRQDTLDAFDAGLRALHGSVECHPEAISLLELALSRLENAFPLSPATWINYLAPAWATWPELLQDVAARIWPGLEPKPHDDMPPLPDDLVALWTAMSESEQDPLRNILRRNATEEGREYLTHLQFSPPMVAGQSPQEVRHLLNKLSEHLWPAAKKHAPKLLQQEHDDWAAESIRSIRRASFDRLARLEAVNRTLAEIERRLGEGDEAAARRFLSELLEQQRSAPLAGRHLHTAKTLANAATIIQRFGKLEWAESLLREACEENHDDQVSAAGLAEVLKARGELEAAEVQYRQNMARWPNDRIAVNGLSNVLRKLKRHAEALALLPTTSGDCYDLHLRAMILLDLGRLEDARVALEQGLKAAISTKQISIFHSGLALLALRAQDFKRAYEILTSLPDNVIPLDLMRLHLEAAQNHSDAVGRLSGALSAREAKMNFSEVRVFKLVHQRFRINAAGVGRQPLEAELAEIFDAEIELQLAA